MIFINKNTSNDLIVTVAERQTLVNPYYLFSFQSHSTKNTVNCICSALSANSRYELFRLIETGSTVQNLTGGTVNLDSGFHTYRIYEQASSTNLTLALTGTLLEQGVAFVSGATAAITYSAATTTLNYIIYNS